MTITDQIRALQPGEYLELRPGDRSAAQAAARREGVTISVRVTKDGKLLVWRLPE